MTAPSSTTPRRCDDCGQFHGRISYGTPPEETASRGDFLKALAVAVLLCVATYVLILVVAAAAIPVPA